MRLAVRPMLSRNSFHVEPTAAARIDLFSFSTPKNNIDQRTRFLGVGGGATCYCSFDILARGLRKTNAKLSSLQSDRGWKWKKREQALTNVISNMILVKMFIYPSTIRIIQHFQQIHFSANIFSSEIAWQRMHWCNIYVLLARANYT